MVSALWFTIQSGKHASVPVQLELSKQMSAVGGSTGLALGVEEGTSEGWSEGESVGETYCPELSQQPTSPDKSLQLSAGTVVPRGMHSQQLSQLHDPALMFTSDRSLHALSPLQLKR